MESLALLTDDNSKPMCNEGLRESAVVDEIFGQVDEGGVLLGQGGNYVDKTIILLGALGSNLELQ